MFGNRLDGYRNSKRMAINGMVKRLCKEEDVGYVCDSVEPIRMIERNPFRHRRFYCD